MVGGVPNAACGAGRRALTGNRPLFGAMDVDVLMADLGRQNAKVLWNGQTLASRWWTR